MKKHRILQLFAVTAPGLEEVCARELAALGLAASEVVPGGVGFSGGLREIYLANLWLRTASRILVRVAAFRCRSFPELFQATAHLPWGQFVKPGHRVRVKAVSHRSRVFHTDRIIESVTAGVERALGPPAAPVGRGEQLVLARFSEDLCQLSIDTSGDLLHRRGYREEAAHAPLRETLAAGVLHLLGWNGREALVDPCCGSGTFPIEAALLAARIPPGARRDFAFMAWPGFRPGLWQALITGAAGLREEPTVSIRGSDQDSLAVAAATRNAARAGIDPLVRLETAELAELRLPPGPGLLLCNPPYGERLGADQDLEPLYRTLGAVFRRAGAGWRCAFLTPRRDLAQATGLNPRPLARLRNGGLEIELHVAGTSRHREK
jgi:putative N6-adenine-specific DNA methylase